MQGRRWKSSFVKRAVVKGTGDMLQLSTALHLALVFGALYILVVDHFA